MFQMVGRSKEQGTHCFLKREDTIKAKVISVVDISEGSPSSMALMHSSTRQLLV
jgi:hypothetical protein